MTYKTMIVDDQFVSREMFRLNISQCSDYEVVYSVGTAMFADTYVLNKKIDLVIMDILIKDRSNGLDTAGKIKKLKPEIKIITVTSMSEVFWMSRTKGIGIYSFWYKEISKEGILEIIQRTLTSESIYPIEAPRVKLGMAKSTGLTPREIEVLRLLTTGAGNDQIAREPGISLNTVKTHIQHMFDKTKFTSRTQLAIQARIAGFVIEDK